MQMQIYGDEQGWNINLRVLFINRQLNDTKFCSSSSSIFFFNLTTKFRLHVVFSIEALSTEIAIICQGELLPLTSELSGPSFLFFPISAFQFDVITHKSIQMSTSALRDLEMLVAHCTGGQTEGTPDFQQGELPY